MSHTILNSIIHILDMKVHSRIGLLSLEEVFETVPFFHFSCWNCTVHNLVARNGNFAGSILEVSTLIILISMAPTIASMTTGLLLVSSTKIATFCDTVKKRN